MKMVEIAVLDGRTIPCLDVLQRMLPSCNITIYEDTSTDEVIPRICVCDAVVVNKVKIGRREIDAAPRLKLIAESATGTDNIDSKYAEERGIAVRNVRSYSTDSVVQTTWMHIMNLATSGFFFNSYVHSGEYSDSGMFSYLERPFTELSRKRMGIVGMGEIGRKVAAVADAFGMKVSYFSTSGTNHCTDYPAVSLDELLGQSDVVSVHAALNDRTRNMMGYKEFSKMKRSAYFVNMGRGAIVDEEALVDALNDGLIAGAATDVYSTEPIPGSHPYLSRLNSPEKLLLSPHIGWTSNEARLRLAEGIARNISDFFQLL